MWTLRDQTFLRSLGITPVPAPPDLPRFRVEPSDRPGWYRVYDAHRQWTLKSEIGPPLENPRGAAEDLAAQLNEKHTPQA